MSQHEPQLEKLFTEEVGTAPASSPRQAGGAQAGVRPPQPRSGRIVEQRSSGAMLGPRLLSRALAPTCQMTRVPKHTRPWAYSSSSAGRRSCEKRMRKRRSFGMLHTKPISAPPVMLLCPSSSSSSPSAQ